MKQFRYIHEADIRFGTGLIKEAPNLIRQLGFVRYAVIVDAGVVKSEPINSFLKSLKRKCKTDLYINNQREPSYAFLENFRKNMGPCDCIIGIGGGSTMDLAKGMAVLKANPGKDAINFKGFPKLKNDPIPVVTIPTLPGTGSEIAYNAVFTDTKTRTRLGINTEKNYPILSIIDPDLAKSALRISLVSSTMDCLCHAVSSYISPGASPFTKALAKEAYKNVYEAISEDLNLEKLYLASMMANMSLNNAGCGLEGAFSYPLGAHWDVPHGVGEGIFLSYLVELYVGKGFRGFSELWAITNPDVSNTTPSDKNYLFVSDLHSLFLRLNVPKLGQWLNENDINKLVELVRPNLVEAPVKITEKDIKTMIETHLKFEVEKVENKQ